MAPDALNPLTVSAVKRRGPEPPGAVNGELCRGRAGKQVACGDGVLEVLLVHPVAAPDAEFPEERDVRRWPAEADAADPAPLTQHCRDWNLAGVIHFCNNSDA
jgi:hypothetical protein